MPNPSSSVSAQILDNLKSSIFKDLNDPEILAIVERSTNTLGEVPILLIGADEATQDDLYNQTHAALASLFSVASGEAEQSKKEIQAAVLKGWQTAVDVAFAAARRIIIG